jgi:uncharacterized protein YjiS (DUF1127 family)
MASVMDATPVPAIRMEFRGGSRLRALTRHICKAWLTGLKRSGDPTRLYRLNDHVLKDIGLARTEIGMGAVESLWRE